MPEMKLARLPDRTPVKIAISLSPDLHQAICDYAEMYRETYGEPAPLTDLVPAMLEIFLASDKAFLQRKRSRRGGA